MSPVCPALPIRFPCVTRLYNKVKGVLLGRHALFHPLPPEPAWCSSPAILPLGLEMTAFPSAFGLDLLRILPEYGLDLVGK